MALGVNTYFVFYDIAVTKFRRKLVKIVESYGNRFQYSVFICQLTKTQKEELEGKIEDYFVWKHSQEAKNDKLALESKHDSVCILLACKQCRAGIVSFGRAFDFDETMVVV